MKIDISLIPTRLQIFILLSKNEGKNLKFLQDNFNVSHVSIVEHLDYLENKKFILRKRNKEKGKRREIILSLTENGKNFLENLKKMI